MADYGIYGQDGFSLGIGEGRQTPMRRRQPIAQQQAFVPAPQPVMHGSVFFEDNGDGTVTAVRLVNAMADDIDLQFEAGSRPVTAIAPKAFMNSPKLSRIVLPDSLRQIGEMAFSGCQALETITIPGSVSKVGTLAFAKCPRLYRVRLEPGVKMLGPSSFSKCQRLTRFDIPASVTGFGGGVFFGCGRQLVLYGAENTIAAQYAKLNGVAFDSQSWKDDEELIYEERADGALIVQGPRREAPRIIAIPSEICGRRIAEIAPKAFFANATIERVSIGSGVERIGESAFFGCQGLISVDFERGLNVIEDSVFAGCTNLSQVTLPWGLSSVGKMAFFGCQRLYFVKMPPTTRIGSLAFDGCAGNLRVFGGVNAGISG